MKKPSGLLVGWWVKSSFGHATPFIAMCWAIPCGHRAISTHFHANSMSFTFYLYLVKPLYPHRQWLPNLLISLLRTMALLWKNQVGYWSVGGLNHHLDMQLLLLLCVEQLRAVTKRSRSISMLIPWISLFTYISSSLSIHIDNVYQTCSL